MAQTDWWTIKRNFHFCKHRYRNSVPIAHFDNLHVSCVIRIVFVVNVHSLRVHCSVCFFFRYNFSSEALLRCWKAKGEKQKRKWFVPIQLGLSLSNNWIMTDRSVLMRKMGLNTYGLNTVCCAHTTRCIFILACQPLKRLQLHFGIFFYEWIFMCEWIMWPMVRIWTDTSI